MRSFAQFDGYIFDLDGCLYRGTEVVSGARELLAHLRNQAKPVVFVSNNSSQTAVELVERLAQMGISAQHQDILVPTDLAANFLLESFGAVSVFALGSPALLESLVRSGHRVVGAEAPACDVVLVARDLGFTFSKMADACRFVQKGAKLVATNPDSFHPGGGGLRVPETGALVAAIVEVTGEPFLALGKPEPYLFAKALDRLGLTADRAVMVGDNLLTDVAGAQTLGLESVWISGPDATNTSPFLPSRICQELKELLKDFSLPQGGRT